MEWEKLNYSEISMDMVESYLFKREKVSACTANSDLRCLRALFNFGMNRKWIFTNPTNGIAFFPEEKQEQYVPPTEDAFKVILAAKPDTQDYLYAIKETMGRMSEVNKLAWKDVNFKERFVTLYTRKKKGGHLTPRKVPMTTKLYDILSHRYKHRDKTKPWVFWHRYWSRKAGKFVEGPYKDRKRIMGSLCKKAGVKYFRYHPLRHLGASTLDNANVNMGSIQRILGHESRRTTEIYLHSIGEAERDAMRIFEEVSQDSHTDSHTNKTKEAS
jgi:integrase